MKEYEDYPLFATTDKEKAQKYIDEYITDRKKERR